MRELYVYWKAPRAGADAVRVAVQTTLTDLMRRHPGLQARLLQRAEEAGETCTWMEIYSAATGISPALQAEIETAFGPVLARLGAGPRHTEVFEPADTQR